MKIQLSVFPLALLVVIQQASAFPTLFLTKHALRLLDNEIEELVELSNKVGGLKEIGRVLGKKNLPNEVLEDAFLRIAFRKEIISEGEAIGMFSRLSGVPGFRTTLRKTIGPNRAMSKGHLNELRVADEARKSNFSVRVINEIFRDGTKKGPADIDVVLEKNGKLLPIETKNYKETDGIPMDVVRKDMDTLVEYARTKQPQEVIPVFAITNKPKTTARLDMLKRIAQEKNIELIFGEPEDVVIQLTQLEVIR